MKMLEYCSVAAVTDGANGLYLAIEEGSWHASCWVDNVISTVGSGDCLLAGAISSQSAGESSRELCITGTRCVAAHVSLPEPAISHNVGSHWNEANVVLN